MGMLDVILTIINVLLAIVSGLGAYKSVKYFQKSKNLTIFAQINKALVEIQKMLIKLPEAYLLQVFRDEREKGLVYTIHCVILDRNSMQVE